LKIDENTFMLISKQVDGLLMEHEKELQRAFDLAGQELDVAFKTTMKSENPTIDVKTEISWLPQPKAKDSAHGRVSPMPLFEENKFDKRTRLHCLWMIGGGMLAKGDFEDYLKRAA
jgi:hypothetical protein